jgi:hypothetical protein
MRIGTPRMYPLCGPDSGHPSDAWTDRPTLPAMLDPGGSRPSSASMTLRGCDLDHNGAGSIQSVIDRSIWTDSSWSNDQLCEE